MADGVIVAFDGVGLAVTDGCYPVADGSDFEWRMSSRVVELGGGGYFDPDAGTTAPKPPRNISQAYNVKLANYAAVKAILVAMEAKMGAEGDVTYDDAASRTGRLIGFSHSRIGLSMAADYWAARMTCTWEVMPPTLV